MAAGSHNGSDVIGSDLLQEFAADDGADNLINLGAVSFTAVRTKVRRPVVVPAGGILKKIKRVDLRCWLGK